MEILSMETHEFSFDKENNSSHYNQTLRTPSGPREMLSDITKRYVLKKEIQKANASNEKLMKKQLQSKSGNC